MPLCRCRRSVTGQVSQHERVLLRTSQRRHEQLVDPDDTAEPDVEKNDDQVEPANGSESVGRVAGDDQGYAGEQGAEARAAGEAEDGEAARQRLSPSGGDAR